MTAAEPVQSHVCEDGMAAGHCETCGKVTLGQGLSLCSITADQIIGAIGRALDAHDMKAVAALMPILAVKDPDSAQAILDTLNVIAPAHSAERAPVTEDARVPSQNEASRDDTPSRTLDFQCPMDEPLSHA